MERNEEMEKSLREFRDARIDAKREYLITTDSELELMFLKNLSDLVNKHVQKQSNKTGYQTKYMFLCCLTSSGYTESYKSLLGMSNEMLYLDKNRSQVYWYPEPLYKNIDSDMEKVEKILRKKFIRLQEAELFRLKQKLLKDDWELLVECFLPLVKKELPVIINSPIIFEKELVVVSGGYMDRPHIIWHSEVGRCE